MSVVVCYLMLSLLLLLLLFVYFFSLRGIPGMNFVLVERFIQSLIDAISRYIPSKKKKVKNKQRPTN